jgi:hypothetical protein
VSAPECDFASDVCWLGTWEHAVIQLWGGTVTVADIEQAEASTKRMLSRHPGGIVSFSLISTSALPRLGDRERQRIDVINKSLQGRLRANVQVVEGRGFGASAVRAILAGINLFNPNRGRIFDDVGAACTWIAAQPDTGFSDGARLVAVVESARAAWHAHIDRPPSTSMQ